MSFSLLTDSLNGSAETDADGLLTRDALLSGSDAVFEIEIPADTLRPRPDGPKAETSPLRPGRVRLRPLTVRDILRISQAARDDEAMTAKLMVHYALVQPALTPAEVERLHTGLVRFLVEKINRISGLVSSEEDVRAMTESPLVQAFFVLAREFGWTPAQVRDLTIGQVVGYLDLLHRSEALPVSETGKAG